MSTLDTAVREEIERNRQAMRMTSLGNTDITARPDDAARLWRQGVSQGMPPALALRNPEPVQRNAEADQLAELVERAPNVAGWLDEKPERLSVARDDLDHLTALDRTLSHWTRSGRPGPQMSALTPENVERRSWGEFAQDQMLSAKVGVQRGTAALLELPVNTMNAINVYLNPIANAYWHATGVAPVAQQPEIIRDLAGGIRGQADATVARRSLESQVLTEGLGDVLAPAEGRGMLREFTDATRYMLRYPGALADMGSEVVGQLIAPGGFVPGKVGLTVLAQGLQAGGMNAAETAEQLREAGASEQEVAEALNFVFTASSVTTSLLPRLVPGGDAAERLVAGRIGESATRGTIARLTVPVAGEYVTEVAQGFTDQVWQNIATGRPLFEGAAGQGAIEGLAGAPMGGAAGVADASIAMRRQARQVAAQRLFTSTVDASRIEELHQQAAAVRTLDRTPTEVEALVRRAIIRDDDSVPRDVYVDGLGLQRYFQSRGMDPVAEVTRITGDPEALAMAVAAGSEVAIPLERYVARVIKSPHSEAIKGMAKLSPGLLSTQELRGLNLEQVLAELEADDPASAAASPQAAQEPAGAPPAYQALVVPPDARSMVSEARWRSYERQLQEAQAEARRVLTDRATASQRRQGEAWYREQLGALRTEVQAEAMQRPELVALSVLSRGRMPDGTPAPDSLAGLSLNRAALVEAYGEKLVLEQLRPRKVYRREGGVTPDEAAALLGFDSGGQLVRALLSAPTSIRSWVDAEATQRLEQRNPEPFADFDPADQANDALHNSKRLKALETELGLLSDLARQPPAQPRILSQAARRRIEGMPRRRIRPNDYLTAERRAARDSTREAAAGNYAAALAAKRRQALNAYLYREAMNAVQEFDRGLRFLRPFTTKAKRAELGKLGADYLAQIDGILEAIELKQVTGREVRRRQSLAEWVNQRAAQGETISVPDGVLALAERSNLRDLPMEQFRGIIETVQQIDHLARLKGKLMLGKELRDRAEIDAQMADSVTRALKRRRERTGDRTAVEKLISSGNQALGVYLDMRSLTRDLDGQRDGGAVWQNVVGVLHDATYNQLNPALEKAGEQLATIWQRHYTETEIRQMRKAVYRPQVDDTWSKGRILSLALNWGNQGNREAILTQVRGRLTPEQVGALLSTLDERDTRFLQDVWAFIDSFWPQVAETQQRRTGLAPQKVDPSPFTIQTSDGATVTLEGGYYPLKYDPEADGKANQDEQEDFFKDVRISRYTSAQTRNGHTKERVGSGGRAVTLELGVINSHVRDVLRDIHLGDAVNYVHGAINGPAFRSALTDAGKIEYARVLDLYLRDYAVGEMAPRVWAERTIRTLRRNFSATLLGFNVSTALIQPTGFFQTGALLGWDVLGTGLRRLLTEPWVGENAITSRVDRASPMMRARAQQSVESVRKVNAALAGKRDSFVLRHAWWMMTRTQRVVDMATWLGAEAAGLRKFNGDLARARAFADDAVVRAQASGDWMDKSALERGTISERTMQSEGWKATTALMSYMMAKGRAAHARTRQTNFRNPLQVAHWTVDMVSLFVIEAMLIAVLRGGLPDDEAEWDEWLAFIAKRGGLEVLSTVPGVAQFGTELRGYDAKNVVGRAAELAAGFIHQVEQGELDRPAVKSGINLVGTVTGLPSAQTNRTLDALWDAAEGEDVPVHEFIVGRRRE